MNLWQLFLLLGLVCTPSFSQQKASRSKEAKILMFGDFGTGKSDQRLVAEDMDKFCAQKGCDFAITTGDNIYPSGIASYLKGKKDFDKGQPDYQTITDVFVNNYKNLNIPIYLTFGNHDVGNNGPLGVFKNFFKSKSSIAKQTLGLINNEISYSNHQDNPKVQDSLGRASRLWYFPDEYYYTDEGSNTHLYSLNTNTYPHRATNETLDELQTVQKNYAQEKWLLENLPKHSGWKIVFGHMPLYSHGRHGWRDRDDIEKFRNSILPTLCKNKVDFYVAGHDHHLEVAKHVCGNGHLIVSVLTGAAAKRDHVYEKTLSNGPQPDPNFLWGNGKFYQGNAKDFKDGTKSLGFSYLEITSTTGARLMMKQTVGSGQDGCFVITKGAAIQARKCD
jgi:hypothetical protein